MNYMRMHCIWEILNELHIDNSECIACIEATESIRYRQILNDYRLEIHTQNMDYMPL